MPLVGRAFVIMWHDITPAGDADYNQWHTKEHMPERIALPGFLRARRGVNRGLPRQHYFTLYEGATLESFVSPEYRRSLNFPTPWTQEIAPQFRNFKRMSCMVASTRGAGFGGAIGTFRGNGPSGLDEQATLASLAPAIDRLIALDGVTAAHIGVARPDFTNGETTETEIRPVMDEPDFQIVVVVEGIGLGELAADQPAAEGILADAGLSDTIGQTYDMAYMLERDRI